MLQLTSDFILFLKDELLIQKIASFQESIFRQLYVLDFYHSSNYDNDTKIQILTVKSKLITGPDDSRWESS